MHVVGVCGPEEQRRAVADRLAARLAEKGRVVRIERSTVAAETGSARARYGLDDDGRWAGAGRDASVDDLLDDVASSYEYAVVSGFPEVAVPQVVVGNVDGVEEPALTYETTDDADLAEVVALAEGTEPYETLSSLVARVKRSENADRAGAVATFTGRVRARDAPDDAPTKFLEFEKYEGVAEQRMDSICADLEAREGVLDVVMHHRTGVVPYGDDIVFVVVLAGHRREAFRAVEDGIDRLKDEVPLFKREVTVDEEFWVHERS